MREVAPRVAATAVILAHRSPRALRKEGTPAVPVSFFLLGQSKTSTFDGVVDAQLEFPILAAELRVPLSGL
jgi:hypothetical protein